MFIRMAKIKFTTVGPTKFTTHQFEYCFHLKKIVRCHVGNIKQHEQKLTKYIFEIFLYRMQ